MCARIGGEEFLIVLPGQGREQALASLERVRHHVQRYAWDLGLLRQTVSIGVATSTPGITQTELLRIADDNLYTAKRGGRNRVVAAADPALPVAVEPSGRRRRARF